eukprot:TRINITY_DN8623_c0_g1_i1.p1 TRINITY_DN8623_c0_g1~~TRINITY_DN8623_c0_g1_i1.p1  ORF type:complete len:562 (+),score=213.65 TRINITY_DN8623_c0_g1_i1:69-1688(+)
MAFSAHQSDRAMEEIRETAEQVDAKAAQLAEMIRKARHVTFFTGAGISTAAGIADYRGPKGVWTLQAQGRASEIRSGQMVSAVPTATHMALSTLVERGLAHHVISQNLDGLHRKSGIPGDNMSELHGNSNVEYCSKCRREYMRDFDVTQTSIEDRGGHETGRRCVVEGCGGALHDTVINFGEGLAPELIAKAFAQAGHSDLHIVLGSSLTVAPASDLPRETQRHGGKLCIVNLQRTPQDHAADLRVHASVNDFMERVMAHLDIPIPAFRVRRTVALWRDGGAVCVAGVDGSAGAPVTLFRGCAVGDAAVEGRHDTLILRLEGMHERGVSVACTPFGHYNEPKLTLELPEGCASKRYSATCLPGAAEWFVEEIEAVAPPSLADVKPGAGGAHTAHRAQGGAAAAETADEKIEDTTDYSAWHAVQPVDDCPHTQCVGCADQTTFDPKAPCGTCGNVGENMMCMSCHEVHCGRHVSQHMLAHNTRTKHPIVCGFIDLSFWCYDCDEYIVPTNPKLLPYYAGFHTAKFGVPPAAAKRAGYRAS